MRGELSFLIGAYVAVFAGLALTWAQPVRSDLVCPLMPIYSAQWEQELELEADALRGSALAQMVADYRAVRAEIELACHAAE